ncbi:hypothetical protein BGZ73_005812 [Actinomortierella ambigua]|nr:hypothetical protein BGZ73_005812 [Actinomortierella ambigua]
MTHSVAPSATASASTSSAEPYSLPPNLKGLIQQYLAVSIPTITFTTELVDLLEQAQVQLHSTRVKVVIRWWKQERASALAVYPKLNNAHDLIQRNVLQLSDPQEPSYGPSSHALDPSSSTAQPPLPPMLSSSAQRPQLQGKQQQQHQGRVRGPWRRLLGDKDKGTYNNHSQQLQQPYGTVPTNTVPGYQQQQRQKQQKGKGNLFKRLFSPKAPSTPRSRPAPEQEERDGVAAPLSDPVHSMSTNNLYSNNNNKPNCNNSTNIKESKPLPDLPESALPLTVAYPLRCSLELFHQYVHNMSALMLEIHICPDLVALATVPDMSELFSNLNGTFSGVFPFAAAVPSRIARHASMAERVLGKRAILGMVVLQAWFQDTSDVADTSEEDTESLSVSSHLSEHLERLDRFPLPPPVHSTQKPHQPHHPHAPHSPPPLPHSQPQPRPPYPHAPHHGGPFNPQRPSIQGIGHQTHSQQPHYPHHQCQPSSGYSARNPYSEDRGHAYQQLAPHSEQQQQQHTKLATSTPFQPQYQLQSQRQPQFQHHHPQHSAVQSHLPPTQPSFTPHGRATSTLQNIATPQQKPAPHEARPHRIQIPVPQLEPSPVSVETDVVPLSSKSVLSMPVRHGRQRSTMDDYARLAAYEPRMSVETHRSIQSSRSRPRADATATAIGRLGTLLTRGEQLMQGIKTSFELDPEEIRVREDAAQRLRGHAAQGELHPSVTAAAAAAVAPRSAPPASTLRQSKSASFPPDTKDPVPYWPNHSRFTLEVAVCTAYLTSRSLLKRSKSAQLPLMKKARTSSPLPAVHSPMFSTSSTSLLPSPHHHHHHQQEERVVRSTRVPGYRGGSLDDHGRISTPAEVSGPAGQSPWPPRRLETNELNRHRPEDKEENGVRSPPIQSQIDTALPSQSPASPTSSSPQTSQTPPRRQLRRSGPSIRPLSVSLTMPGFSQFLQQQQQALSPSRQESAKDEGAAASATTGYQSFGPAPPGQSMSTGAGAADRGVRGGAASHPLRGPPSTSSFVPIVSTASRQPPYEGGSDSEEARDYDSGHRRRARPSATATTSGQASSSRQYQQQQRPPLPGAEQRLPLPGDVRSARREEHHDPQPHPARHGPPPPPTTRDRRPRLDSQDRLQIRMDPAQIAKLGQLPSDVYRTRLESHLVVPALLSNYSTTSSEAGESGRGGRGARGAGSSSQRSPSRRRHLRHRTPQRGGVLEDDGEDEEELARRYRHGRKGKGRADASHGPSGRWDAPTTTSSRHSRESFSTRHLRQKQQQYQEQYQQRMASASGMAAAAATRTGYHTAGQRRRRSSTSSSVGGDSFSQSHRSISVSSAFSHDSMEEKHYQQRSAKDRRLRERNAVPHPQSLRQGKQYSSQTFQESGQRDATTKKLPKANKEKRGHPQRFDFVTKTNLLLTPETVATLMMRRLAVEVWKVNQRTKEATDLGVAKVPLSTLIQEIMQQMQGQQPKVDSTMSSSGTTTTHSWGATGGGSSSWKTLRRGGSSQHSLHYAHSRQSSHHPHHPYQHDSQGENTKRSQRHLHDATIGYGGGGGLKHQQSFSGLSSRRGVPILNTATASKFGSTLNPTPFIPLEDDYLRQQRLQQQQQQQQQQQGSRGRTIWELGPRMYRIHSRRGTVIGHLEAVVRMRPRNDSQSDGSVFSRAA